MDFRRTAPVIRALSAIVIACTVFGNASVSAQGVAAFRKLDRNGDGAIQENEASASDRTVLSRFASALGIPARFPMSIDELESALKKAASDSGQSTDGRSGAQRDRGAVRPPLVLGFGNGSGSTFVPGFGTNPDNITRSDLQLAQETLKRFDRNDDGLLSERELRRLRLRGDEMSFDNDRDEHLDRDELAAALALQRALGADLDFDRDGDDDRRGGDRNDGNERRRDRDRDRGERDRNRRPHQRLVSGVFDIYDVDQDDVLSELECALAGHKIAAMDADGNKEVTQDELSFWLEKNYPEPAPREPTEIPRPEWFEDLDANRDGQVSFREFVTDLTQAQADEFESIDTNTDGFITLKEAVLSAEHVGDYQSNSAVVIAADSRAISEIEVHDDFLLADLDVHISITHSRDEDLDIFLMSPDGTRVELIAGVGGSDDHFDGTIVDDESEDDFDDRDSRPPFRGRFRSTGCSRRQDPCLRDFYIDEPLNIKGVWSLVIVSERSDRAGILHRWALSAQPRD